MESTYKKGPEEKSISNSFESGTLFFDGKSSRVDEIEWIPHPTYNGVYLKHLFTGSQINNQVSCHIVRVNPGCELGLHAHCGKSEIHEVIEGSGLCTIGVTQLTYHPGSIAVITPDVNHKVVAGDNGLVIMAKFLPALF